MLHDRKVYTQNWNQTHKEWRRNYNKKYSPEWKKNNREYIKNWRKHWMKKNRERYNQSQREYRLKNKEKYEKYSRERSRKLKLEVLTHYGGNPPKCTCCGETEIIFLTIDHIDGGGREHRKKVGDGSTFYRWLIKNNYPVGYQILCYNCNCGKAKNGGICPHQINK